MAEASGRTVEKAVDSSLKLGALEAKAEAEPSRQDADDSGGLGQS